MALAPEVLQQILKAFGLSPGYKAEPLGQGHINDTLLLSQKHEPSWVLQRINHLVFNNPEGLMFNLKQVRDHLLHQSDCSRNQLKLLSYRSTGDGHTYLRMDSGDYWRVNPFIKGTVTVERVQDASTAHKAAAGFGQFISLLDDLPPDRLQATIPDFHNATLRLAQLDHAVEADTQHRVATAQTAISFAKDHQHIIREYEEMISSGTLPQRITHNDTKVNNILFDQSGEVAGVIDLDTMMPGYVMYDFGDMVRTFTPGVGEDESDLSQVGVRMDMFKGLVEGFLSASGPMLTKTEIDSLVFGGKLMTYVQGIRFLTDYLEGDLYYQKTKRPDQNLDRALNQFKLLESIMDNEAAMEEIVRQIS